MVVETAGRHRLDRRGHLLGLLDRTPRLEDHRHRLHEVEFAARCGPGDHLRLAEAVLDDIEQRLSEIIHVGMGVGVEHAQPLGERAIMQIAARPDGEVVAELRVVERRSQGRFAEVVIETLVRRGSHALMQLAQVQRIGDSPHADDQGAVFDFERR